MSIEEVLAPQMTEAHRQLEICNACRYCEGYCAVFPAMMRHTSFASGDLNHLANLCHNCRGCYYSCQYVPPHEFAINIPAILADVRQTSWESYIQPHFLSKRFHSCGLAMSLACVALFTGLFWWLSAGAPASAQFYDHLSHNLLVSIFGVAFLGPMLIILVALRSYWKDTGGRFPGYADLRDAFFSVARMKNLAGGHGEGCNFEKEDRFTNARRYAHQAVFWGFILCFLATASGTIMHYVFNWPAPYGVLTPPKLFGIPGGILLVLGAAELIRLKFKADPTLGAERVWRGELAFTTVLGLTGLSGLLLYAVTGTGAVKLALAFHLACVLTLFLTMPFSKMVHGFFRLSALIIEAQKRRVTA